MTTNYETIDETDSPPEDRADVVTDGGVDDPLGRSEGETHGNGDPTNSEDGDHGDGLPIGRRALLGGGVAGGVGLAAGAYLFASSDDEDEASGDGASGDEDEDEEEATVPDDHVPFSVWAEQREAVRSSPDHLPARAERLVEEGDLEELFAFVRDEIVTVPTHPDGFDDVATTRRWGPRGALRCGTGTPRDKADLLATLYRDAGYESEVVEARERLQDFGLNDEEALADRILADVDREYDPDVDEETIEDWHDRLETDDPTIIEFVDEEGDESEALAASVREWLPEGAAADTDEFRWYWETPVGARFVSMPIVAVTDDEGERRYANLFLDVPFGRVLPDSEDEADAQDDLEPIDDPGSQTVAVTLSAATPGTLVEGETFDLVSGEWTVPELIGRQLRVRTTPLADPFVSPEMNVNDLTAFTPTLAVQGMDRSDAALAELSEFGDLVTLTGDRLSIDHEMDGDEMVVDDVVTRDGETFYDPAEEADPVAVESIDVEADPGDYPRIGLEIAPRDADGNHVHGLVGSMFAARDEGEAVAPTMVRSAARPRVLLVRDVSRSMVQGPLDDLPRDDGWYDDLVSAIEDAVPGVEIEVREEESEIWTHLTQAVVDSRAGVDGHDLIVYAHDGEPTDDLTDSMVPLLEDAPPTVLISAHDDDAPVEDETVREQADIMDARAVSMGDREAVETAILDELADLDVPYRLEYHVPAETPDERTVEVTIGDDPEADPIATAEASYEPPDETTTSTLVGLYLTVEVGDRSVTRTLAGWDLRERGTWDPEEVYADPDLGVEPPELAADADDVRNAIFGGVDIAFEGDGVPYGVAVDDFLSANLTRERLGAVSIEGEYEEQYEVLQEGYAEIPWELLQVMAPLPNAVSEDGLTFFDAPRIAVSQAKPTVFPTDDDEIAVERTMDVLPLARCSTAATDAADGFELTLERTAAVAVAEREAYNVSTASLLEGVDLGELADVRSALDDERAEAFDTLRERAGVSDDDYQLVPADGSELAFWNVDEETGALLGILDDGTGGARRFRSLAFQDDVEDIQRFAEVVKELIKVLRAVGALSGPGAHALGVVADHFAELAKLYAQVTGVLAAAREGSLSEVDTDLRDELEEMIENVGSSLGDRSIG